MAGQIKDCRKKVMTGGNLQPGNVVLLEDQKTLLMWTDKGFINVISGTSFPYKYSEILEVRDVVLHDNVLDTIAYMMQPATV